MADIRLIADILSDRGYCVHYAPQRAVIPCAGGNVTFTGEYARFLENPNLYYFRDDPTEAANFIDDGCHNLIWTEDDWRQSLNCEKDQLYFICKLYRKFTEKETVTQDEAHNLYCLFKDSISELLIGYCNQFGLTYKSFRLSLRGSRTVGKCSRDGNLEFSTDLILRNPNFIKSVILHELCHTLFHNHGLKFWTILSAMMAEAGITPLSGYVNKELFARRKDYYIEIPVIRSGPDDRYLKCIPHYDMFRKEQMLDR